MPEARTLQDTRDLFRAYQTVRQWFDDPRASCRVTATAEAANKRTFTVQVTDRLLKNWTGRWKVFLYLSTTAAGDPDGTGNTVAFTTGLVLNTTVINGAWDVLTDVNGVAVFDLTIAGAATRYVGTLPTGGRPLVSDSFTWT